MWENILVGVLVSAAVLCVIRRLVKGAGGGGCGSCKCGGDAGASCSSDQADTPSEGGD